MTDQPPTPPAVSLRPPRFQAARTIVALMLREMGATYGASPGGYIWAVLQPVGVLIMLSLGFSLIVRAPSLGSSFILFYATGFLPFNFYAEIAGKTGGSLRYARALLAYPSVTWVDAVLSRFLLNLLTLGMVFCLVITGILIVDETRTIINVAPILTGIAMAALTGLGIGLNNAVLGGLFPIWANIWLIVSRPLFLASCIFYIYEDLPRAAQNILWWNPLVHVAGLVRAGFYPTYGATYVSLSYGFGLALALILLGLIFMRANYTRVLEN